MGLILKSLIFHHVNIELILPIFDNLAIYQHPKIGQIFLIKPIHNNSHIIHLIDLIHLIKLLPRIIIKLLRLLSASPVQTLKVIDLMFVSCKGSKLDCSLFLNVLIKYRILSRKIKFLLYVFRSHFTTIFLAWSQGERCPTSTKLLNTGQQSSRH